LGESRQVLNDTLEIAVAGTEYELEVAQAQVERPLSGVSILLGATPIGVVSAKLGIKRGNSYIWFAGPAGVDEITPVVFFPYMGLSLQENDVIVARMTSTDIETIRVVGGVIYGYR